MPLKRVLTVGAAVAICMGSMTGCGSSSHPVSAKGAAALKKYVEAVRQAAAGTNALAVQEAVVKLQAEVDKEEREGRITSGRRVDIDNAATQLYSDFNLRVKPTPSASTPSTTPSSTPPTTPTTPTTPTSPTSPTSPTPPTSPSTPTPPSSPTGHSSSSGLPLP